MKRFLFLLAALCAVLIGCSTQATPVQETDVLLVTDGTSEKQYELEDLQSLQAAQAVFRDISYTGVPLSLLLEDAGFDTVTLSAVKATARDGFSANYEPALIARPDTLVAYARIDGPLADDEGAFRMVLPDQEGKLNPRKLVEIRVYP